MRRLLDEQAPFASRARSLIVGISVVLGAGQFGEAGASCVMLWRLVVMALRNTAAQGRVSYLFVGRGPQLTLPILPGLS